MCTAYQVDTIAMELPDNFFAISLLSLLWTLPWKGLALWKAAQHNHKKWFITILIVNTFAILEIVYLFFIPPKIKLTFNWGKKNKHPKKQ